MERTSGDIFRDFYVSHQELRGKIEDWRPLKGNVIQIWMTDGTIYHFNDETKEFKQGQDEYAR